MGSLALLLAWSPGHTQLPGGPPRPGGTPDALPARPDARPALAPPRGDGPRLPGAGKPLAPAGANAGTDERFRRPDHDGDGLPGRRAPGTVPSPLAPLIAAKKAGRDQKGAASRLPANAPAWFREYDTDGDGQVSLHEWRARGHSIEDFQKADLNGDGFLTLKELMRAGLFVPSTGATPPPTARQLMAQVGKFYYFEVTGAGAGAVWGTDVYTADSAIATAAVHAGVLRVGQRGFIKVTILPGQQGYEGSTRNGVTTHDFGAFPGSYRVGRP
jgi:hypothetical protein